MILYITPDVRTLALRIRTFDLSQVASIDHIQLCLHAVPHGDFGRVSPIYLRGWWPVGPTNWDVANDHPLSPTFHKHHWHHVLEYPAHHLDDDGRVVFVLDDRLHAPHYFRFDAKVVYMDKRPAPTPLPDLGEAETRRLDLRRAAYTDCGGTWIIPPPPPHMPPPCVLAEFDIQVGPRCSDMIVDQVAFETTRITCAGDDCAP